MGARNVHDSKAHRQEPDKKRVRGITSGCTGSPINMAPGEPQRWRIRETVRISLWQIRSGLLYTRMKAWALDVFLGFVVISISSQIFADSFQKHGLQDSASGFLTFAGMFVYWVLIPFRWQGRTFGKCAFGLRLLDRSSRPLRVGQLIKRCLLYFMTILDTMTWLGVEVDESGALLHDRKCNAIVVSSRHNR